LLWYDHAAETWQQALPAVNGCIGAVVFGHPLKERLQLNDDSLWPADMGWDKPAGTVEDLSRIRTLLFKGDHAGADALCVKKFSRKRMLWSLQTVWDLFIESATPPEYGNAALVA
jgi:alpha-L-fucosidase 2